MFKMLTPYPYFFKIVHKKESHRLEVQSSSEAEDEAEGFVELDQQEVENDEGCALGDATTEGSEGVAEVAQTA